MGNFERAVGGGESFDRQLARRLAEKWRAGDRLDVFFDGGHSRAHGHECSRELGDLARSGVDPRLLGDGSDIDGGFIVRWFGLDRSTRDRRGPYSLERLVETVPIGVGPGGAVTRVCFCHRRARTDFFIPAILAAIAVGVTRRNGFDGLILNVEIGARAILKRNKSGQGK